jgi:hypothetical protein
MGATVSLVMVGMRNQCRFRQAALMDEMMESLSILSGGKIIEGELYKLSVEDNRGEGDEAPLGEGPAAVQDRGEDGALVADGGEGARA